MKPDPTLIRRKALHAAASVVLAFNIGCLEKDEDDDDVVDTGDTVSTDDTSLPDSGTPGDDTAVTDDTATEGPPDCTAEGADMATCCEELAEWCAGQHEEASEAYNECVWGPGFDGSTGCIPWGPPVPPAMA